MDAMLTLDGMEAILLVGRISNDETDFYQETPIAVPLLLKIFSVFNQLVAEDGIKTGSLAISIDQREAWLLRKCVSPSDTSFDGRPIGIILLRKIHQILLDYNFPRQNIAEIIGLPVMSEEYEEGRQDAEPTDQDPDQNPAKDDTDSQT